MLYSECRFAEETVGLGGTGPRSPRVGRIDSSYPTEGDVHQVTSGQSAVLGVLEQHAPLPDHALVPLVQHVANVRMSSSGIRSRRAELVEQGKVKQVDTVKMPSGREAAVWDLA